MIFLEVMYFKFSNLVPQNIFIWLFSPLIGLIIVTKENTHKLYFLVKRTSGKYLYKIVYIQWITSQLKYLNKIVFTSTNNSGI